MPNDQDLPLFSLSNFKLTTPQGKVLKESLSFELCPGDVLYLKGENGKGKTTLAKEIFTRLKKQKINVEFLPQLSSLSSSLPFTLAEVISMTEEELKELPSGLISLDILQRPWNHASGGERKKALLVRSLLKKPDILILDEPFNHLDVESVSEIQSLIWRLVRTQEVKAIVLASHQEIKENPGLENVSLKEVSL